MYILRHALIRGFCPSGTFGQVVVLRCGNTQALHLYETRYATSAGSRRELSPQGAYVLFCAGWPPRQGGLGSMAPLTTSVVRFWRSGVIFLRPSATLTDYGIQRGTERVTTCAKQRIKLLHGNSCVRRAHDRAQHSAEVFCAPSSILERHHTQALGDVRHRGLHDGVAACEQATVSSAADPEQRKWAHKTHPKP